MSHKISAFLAALIATGSLLVPALQAQTNSPTLAETFDWMANTLKPYGR